MRRTPTRLELHRLKHRHGGGLVPLLAVHELDEDERSLLSHDFFKTVWADGHTRDVYEIYAEVLAGWGVMCPHPAERLRADGRWERCGACGAHLGPYSRTNDPAQRRAWG